MLLSGMVWGYTMALWNLQQVKPFWICNRVLMPDFFTFFSYRGVSFMVESSVRINDAWHVEFVAEFLIDAGTDPIKKKKYSDKDIRLGFGGRLTENFFLGGHSLLNHVGGDLELTFTNKKRFWFKLWCCLGL